MKKDHVLGDVMGSLMLSFATIITMFHLVNRFLTPLYGALIIIGGLIAAIVFLFVNQDNRRNMRIASIACNSIAIGSIIGILFQLLGHSMTIVSSIIIGALFLGIVFLIYLFFYDNDTRTLPGVVIGILLFVANLGYWYYIYPLIPSSYNVYIVMFDAITIIHYIIALIVVCSDKKTIIDGMAYGYFGISLVILVVAGIFLLIASEGDIDLDIDPGVGGSKREKKVSKVRSKGASKKINNYNYDALAETQMKIRDVAETLDSLGIESSQQMIMRQNHIIENSFYMAYLGSSIDNVTIKQIKELNELEMKYRAGYFNKEEYARILDQYK